MQSSSTQVEDIFFWAPSRQIITNLTTDTLIIAAISQGVTIEELNAADIEYTYNADPADTYVEYNKSRELQITRNGPINGAVVNVSSFPPSPTTDALTSMPDVVGIQRVV